MLQTDESHGQLKSSIMFNNYTFQGYNGTTTQICLTTESNSTISTLLSSVSFVGETLNYPSCTRREGMGKEACQATTGRGD